MRILTEPDASLTAQYKALLGTEKVDVEFAKDGVRRIAEIAFSVNERTENIGARRLHTVMERLLETVSFDAAENGGIDGGDRRRLRGPASRHAGQGRGPEPLHPVSHATIILLNHSRTTALRRRLKVGGSPE